MRCFFYGTLMDANVAAVVLGRRRAAPVWRPAVLWGYVRRGVVGATYPALAPRRGHAVHGIFAAGLSAGDLSRLRYFEGGREYSSHTRRVVFADGDVTRATVFLPTRTVKLDRRGWDFASWQVNGRAAFVKEARAHMARYRARPVTRVGALPRTAHR